MENEPEVIRDQMQDTRTALAEKLEALQQTVAQTVENTTKPVLETVQSVTEATRDTASTVKETVAQIADTVSGSVEKTVSTVKETFDITRHVDQHPWMMVCGSAAVGYLIGRLLPAGPDRGGWSSSSSEAVAERMTESPYNPRRESSGHNGHGTSERERSSSGHSWLSGLYDTFHDQIHALEGLAVAAAMGVARDVVTQNLQGEIGQRLGEWMNDLTQKLGGRPLTEPVVGKEEEQKAQAPRTGYGATRSV
jgi:ElaB/YqjD/DUF883 family membrane-anchored ribosome-binding protein